jgi:SAM-dependent methyltransferase
MEDDHPSLALIRMSVFLSFATTFLGFGVLALSAHAMLKSIGLALVLGIGYSFVGAVTIVPTLAGRLFTPAAWPREAVAPGSAEHLRRVLGRYRHMEAYTRILARFKILLDPMFPRLAGFVKDPRIILDVGCGYGIAAVWLLALYPEARVFGIDPDRRRVHFAAHAVGPRGSMQAGRAPDIPDAAGGADTILLLDVIHMLSDEDLQLTLERLRRLMVTQRSVLVIRSTVPLHPRPSFERWLEDTRLRLHSEKARYRSVQEVSESLVQAGFRVVLTEQVAPRRELYWFLAELA